MGEKRVEALPPDFRFSPDDPFYLAPPFCKLLHYKNASLVSVGFEVFLLAIGLWSLTKCHDIIASWVLFSFGFLLILSLISAIALIVAVFTEKAPWCIPKMLVLQLEISVMMVVAFVAIVAMSVGIEATNWLFSFSLRVSVMEKQFGPIWPFNIAALAFFAAAVGVWSLSLVKGAQDFILDKQFFLNSPTFEMVQDKDSENWASKE